jgi:hypothetical protein
LADAVHNSRRRSDHVLCLAKQRQQQFPPNLMAELVGTIARREPDGVDDGVEPAKSIELALAVGCNVLAARHPPLWLNTRPPA